MEPGTPLADSQETLHFEGEASAPAPEAGGVAAAPKAAGSGDAAPEPEAGGAAAALEAAGSGDAAAAATALVVIPPLPSRVRREDWPRKLQINGYQYELFPDCKRILSNI